MTKLTKSNCRVISNLCLGSAQVFLGSMIIPVFTGGFDLADLSMILFALALFVTMFRLALLFGEKGKL